MGVAVVRCTGCLGLSRVEAGALGLTVQCPRCDATFVAAEEATPVEPARAPRNPTLPVPEPVAEPAPGPYPGLIPRRPRRRARDRGPGPESVLDPAPVVEVEHDPHLAPPHPLPASVLIGLALLPFLIPILWLVAPAATGVEPAMTVATPAALALSASVLCLAVIYTIDWTPATRVKGVMMLVGLSYFAALSLYFLKKETVEQFKRWTGLKDDIEWLEFERPDFKVLMPGPEKPAAVDPAPVRRAFRPECFTADYERALFGHYQFVAGSAAVTDDGDPKPGTDAWYAEALNEIVVRSGGKRTGDVHAVMYDDIVRGREVIIGRLPKGTVRIVRVLVINGRAYYLSVEGLGLNPNDDLARAFFESFQLRKDGD